MSAQRSYSHWITSSGREGSSGPDDALFPYWSFTKTAISICALKLVENGALELDGALENNPYSLRQLLAHTAGLADYGQVEQYHAAVTANETPWPRDRLLDAALARGPLFEPGQGWSYSNIGYMFVRELIEATAGKSLGEVISELICKPLALKSIQLAETRAQFGRLHWPAAAAYDPRWVYHGCLTGTASDAAHLLHALISGDLLRPDTLHQMLNTRPLGGPIPGRPWTKCGYALGLMSGAMDHVGTAVGHTGGGPFSVNANYHFPDVSDPITVACFTAGTAEGVVEFEAMRIARDG
jgi:CubicO group peptidase (beta-lactamase class C family)